MEFTIITPSFNYAEFLGDCLQSTAEADGIELEHWVIDGGSTDESAAIAARFPHIQWLQEPDRGMSHAINKGFDRAKGRWVMWLNADDRLKPGALPAIRSYLLESRADVVYGHFDWMNREGKIEREVRLPKWSTFVHIHHHCYVPSTAAFYRRATVIDGGHRLREDFHYVMDGEFYARLDQLGMQFELAPVVVADFRDHGSNASQKWLRPSKIIDDCIAAEHQHAESRAIRRAYGITPFRDPYLNGISDGLLWLVARCWKVMKKLLSV